MRIARFVSVTTLALIISAAGACGKSDSPTSGVGYGTVMWKLDLVTCTTVTYGTGPISWDLFVDGSLVGTNSISIASPMSNAHYVAPGQHTLTMRVTGTTVMWTPVSGYVSPGGGLTYVIRCTGPIIP